ANDFIHQIGIIRWIHADGIAYLEAQSPAGKIELKMSRVLFRLRPTQPAIDQHSSGRRIGPRKRPGGNSRTNFSHSTIERRIVIAANPHPSFPMASVGQTSSARCAASFSSGVSGCLEK